MDNDDYMREGEGKGKGERESYQPPPKDRSYVVFYNPEVVNEDVLQTWPDSVAPHFKKVGLQFSIDEARWKMILKTNGVDNQPLSAPAMSVLDVLTSNFSSGWVEPILDRRIFCMNILLGMSKDKLKDLEKKYQTFYQGFRTYHLRRLWNCIIHFFDNSILVVATTFAVVDAVRCLVNETLLGNEDFDRCALLWFETIYKYKGEDIREHEQLLWSLVEKEHWERLMRKVVSSNTTV